MDKKQIEAFVELDRAVLIATRLEIQKREKICEKANKIDHGLRHKELPRVTFWAYVWENFKKEFKIIFKF